MKLKNIYKVGVKYTLEIKNLKSMELVNYIKIEEKKFIQYLKSKWFIHSK